MPSHNAVRERVKSVTFQDFPLAAVPERGGKKKRESAGDLARRRDLYFFRRGCSCENETVQIKPSCFGL